MLIATTIPAVIQRSVTDVHRSTAHVVCNYV